MPSEIQLPDLFQRCSFELRISSHCKQASLASDEWLRRGAGLSDEKMVAVKGLKAGLLAAMCYPTVDAGQFRVCCDFINLFFFIRGLANSMDAEGITELADVILNTLYHPHFVSDCVVSALLRSVWTRLRKTSSSTVLRRLAQSLEDLLKGLEQQAYNRMTNTVPDLESFVELQQLTSACIPAFILLEYAHGMRLPHDVYLDPRIVQLNQLASNLVCWSNDILSFTFDQAHGSTHNMVFIAMDTNGFSVQQAVNYVAALYQSTMEVFIHGVAEVHRGYPHSSDPPYDPIAADVATYVRGLQDWIIGSLHWGFETERYFGDQGDRIRMRRRVVLGL